MNGHAFEAVFGPYPHGHPQEVCKCGMRRCVDCDEWCAPGSVGYWRDDEDIPPCPLKEVPR